MGKVGAARIRTMIKSNWLSTEFSHTTTSAQSLLTAAQISLNPLSFWPMVTAVPLILLRVESAFAIRVS
jgi:hypothetical protein